MSIRSLALAVLCCTAFPAAAHADVPPNPRDGEVNMMCRQINSLRVQNGVAPMRMSSNLVSAATWMAGDMANKNYFSHTDSLGRRFSTRLTAFGFGGTAAENIAAGTSDATTMLNLWKNSAGHRANMLNARYNVMGIGRGYKPTSAYTWYWTANFGASSAYSTPC